VLFRVVVVGLHHVKHLAILAAAIAERGAVVALLQLDDPDAFT